MILRPRPSAFGLLFTLRGSVVLTIAPRVFVVLLVSAAVTWLYHAHPALPELTPAPFTLLGLALSIFLGFRNNACYDRWWEARKQWGQLIVETRCLVRDVLTLLPADDALRRRIGLRAIAFAASLRAQLRGVDGAEARDWLPAEERDGVRLRRNRPDAVLRELSLDLGARLREGDITDILYQLIERRLTAMSSIQAACERLRSTPTPFTYTLLLHRTAWLFCLLLPFGLVGSLGTATPILSTILAYAFFGLDALGGELEEPFSRSQNAVPLDALVRGIEIDVLEVLGEADLPAPLQAERFILP